MKLRSQPEQVFLPLLIVLILSNCIIEHAEAIERPVKPNVVLILTDDLGWQDVGCYDIDDPCPYDTPNINRLATQGVQFFQGYSPAPTCSPSRVAILSGKHPARSQKTHVVGGHPPAPYAKNSIAIEPWYSGRMKLSEITIAEALQANGYKTGCVGKWHCAINHNAFPQPKDQGFDVSYMNRGVSEPMRPDRLSEFSTTDENNRFRLDTNGIPRDQNTIDALKFLNQNKSEPFFLYYATWLVHTPIHSRSKPLLEKYCKKMGIPVPEKAEGWNLEGQNNPFYGAMVESLDYYVGQLINYLKQTDDPRWPGHKLIDNTYIIFTSDNGGMEKVPNEIITDNAPLDKGKINAKEGGVRVPLIISGPDIKPGISPDAIASGLDFYPTILNWTGTPKPKSQQLDGLDLTPFLQADKRTRDLIRRSNGKPRDTMVWHFPNSVAMQSTIRRGNYKLIRNLVDNMIPNRDPLDLYQLYDDSGNRVDIEEANDLAESKPELARELNTLLQFHLDEMNASPPFLNPKSPAGLPNKNKVCIPLDHGINGREVWATFKESGAKVVSANLIYTNNGGKKYEEWYRLPASISSGGKVTATLPGDATHYVFNLIDENHFLVSYPEMKFLKDRSAPFSARAFKAPAKQNAKFKNQLDTF
ncbi:MAG: sulfatase [Pirellulales bacterium]